MNKLTLRSILAAVAGIVLFAVLVFVPAWTLDYWQAWAFLATFIIASTPVSIYVAVRDPALFERRMNVGPAAESRPEQKAIMSLILAGFIALLVVPGLDHRFGWSDVPVAVCLAGDALLALSYVCFFYVFRENTFGAANIQVVEGQKVISTGPYAIVRHPMYAGALIMLVGIPLALGSWWGLIGVPVMFPVFVWRLVDEERFLAKNLPGYADYMKKLRWRLIPGVF